MKIHAIVVVKNEADIIEYSLRAASAWADHIHVFDTGSSDDTWRRVRKLAAVLPCVIPWKQEARPFSDELCGEVFRAHRATATTGDWWCRLDSDEFFAEDPRHFLSQVPRRHHVVWGAHLQFYFTDADVRRFDPDSLAIPDIHENNRPRRYRNNWSEIRFFRHRNKLRWDCGNWPVHIGVVHPRRIPVRHFQYRSPQQIQLRLDTRRQAANDGCPTFGHSLQRFWREAVRPAANCHLDDGKSPLIVEPNNMPAHLEHPLRRTAKLIMHGLHIWP